MRTKIVKRGKSRNRTKPEPIGDNGKPEIESLGFLNQREAANVLGCTERTLRRWMSDRLVPYFKLGKKRVRFKRSDLEAHFEKIHMAALN